MSAHTPGPWDVSSGGLNVGTYIDGMWVTVADVPAREYIVERPLAQREADARLIAAAPDLLAACEALQDEDRLRELAQRIRDYDAEPILHLLDAVFPEIVAAITRARLLRVEG